MRLSTLLYLFVFSTSVTAQPLDLSKWYPPPTSISGYIDMPVGIELHSDSLYLSIFREAGLYFDREYLGFMKLLLNGLSDEQV